VFVVRRIAAKLLTLTGLSQAFLIRRNGYVLRFHPSSFSAGLWINPHAATHDEDFLRRYLRSEDVVLDVGANIGTMTLSAATIAKTVHAIEAHPRTYSYLTDNIALNGRTNAHALNVAAAEQAGSVTFSDLADDDLNHIDTSGNVTVPAITIDSLELGPIALLKIDVEGFELPALRGAIRTLGVTDCVYFESFAQNCERYGFRCPDVIKLLRQQGFCIFKLSHDVLSPITDAHNSPECENLIAARNLDDLIGRTAYKVAAGTNA
jgi:FkbM family methyltransferase